MNQKPLVSVIIPYYNNDNERFLRECFDSVAHQTYSSVEFIVIDDGSTEKASALLEKFQKKYQFILKKQMNKGICGALNTGIKQANGKYVAYMGADDYWALNKIELQVQLLENADQSVVGCCTRAYFVYENDPSKPVPRLTRVLTQADLTFNGLLRENCIIASSMMIKREIFDEIGLFDKKSVLEDWDMWLRITDKFQLTYLPEPLTYHRRHLNNRSNRFDKEMYETLKYILNKWKGKEGQNQSLNQIELLAISKFSRHKKLYALKLVLSNLQCANKLSYWKGFFKIFVPVFFFPK